MQHLSEIPVSNILLIDDHVLVAEGFKELLLKIVPVGCSVDVLHSTDKAKLKLKCENYQFIITDLLIPGQDVLEFIAHVRKNYNHIIVIVITGVVDVNSIRACLAAGANGYLSKAIDPRDIDRKSVV